MTQEEKTKIEDEISVLNSDLSINTKYDAQFRYYERKLKEKEFTYELLKEEV